MKLAYFDCFSGISGDMVLGALVDAGLDLRALEAELRKLNLDGWKISAEKVQRQAIRATKVNVETQEHHHHRHLSGILKMIDGAALAPRAADRARQIFQRLGEAEAKVHNIAIEKVHFHEVGAIDSIVDIVGAAIGFELLGIDNFACSSMDVGAGRVKTEHGLLPVPAPATAELLRGAPTFSSGIEKELVTPTGAAIATTLAARFAAMPPMQLTAVGYGAGAAGALDIFAAAVQMKKNRPGLLVTILCEPSRRDALIDLLFRETTTIGVRTHEVARETLARESVPVETPLGTIRIKLSRRDGVLLNAAPEYEDCQRIAAEKGVPLKQVLASANFHFQKLGEPAKLIMAKPKFYITTPI